MKYSTEEVLLRAIAARSTFAGHEIKAWNNSEAS